MLRLESPVKEIPQQRNEENSQSVSSFSTNFLEPNHRTTVDTLDRMSRRLMDLLNTRAFDDLWIKQHLSPSVRQKVDYPIEAKNLESPLDTHRWICEKHPSYRVEIISVDVSLNRHLNRGHVWLTNCTTGDPENEVRECTLCLTWVKTGSHDETKWMLTKVVGLRGLENFT